MNGYCCALIAERSTSCCANPRPLISVSDIPLLLIPITSNKGLSPGVFSAGAPRQINFFHCLAGPNSGEVVNPILLGVKQSTDKVILSRVPSVMIHFGVKDGSFFL